jgi:hypothetical protein
MTRLILPMVIGATLALVGAHPEAAQAHQVYGQKVVYQ